ncbi:MAG: peptidyl-prolyl cis-trans isomerase [Phycisphaerae bacterium]|nr:peptidyl-prolyl cis-trans isomerase [Phycisphaerae bacterium]
MINTRSKRNVIQSGRNLFPGNTPRPLRFCVHGIVCLSVGITVITLGCSPGLIEKDRTGTQTLHDLETDRLERAATQHDDGTPVSRLFVNGDVIEAEGILRPIRAELAHAAQTLTPYRYQKLLEEKIIDEFRHQARTLLLYQEAAKRLSQPEEEFLQGLVDDTIRKRVNSEYGGRQAHYEKALGEQGLTMAEDRERTRRDMVVMRHLHQTIMQRVVDPTRAELVRFFEERKDDLTKPQRRKMSLIEIPRKSSGDNPGADELIRQALAELGDGVDFATVATRHSKGIHAEEGGVWDWLTRGSVRERWEPAVEKLFELHEGQISSIIETDQALFLVRCDAIDPAIEPDFEAIQPRLMQVFRDLQFNRLIDERVRQLQQKAVFIPKDVGRFLQAVADAAPKPKDT